MILWPQILLLEADFLLKMYGKKESKPKRKLGHLNAIDIKNTENIDGLLKIINKIKKSIVIEPIS